MEQATPQLLETHLMLPAWWVKAYDVAATCSDDAASGAMGQAYASGLAPAMSSVELNALAAVLATLQAQLLSGQELTVSTEAHLKNAATAAPKVRFHFEKVVQMLTGIRLLRQDEDAALRSRPLFTADQWSRRGDEVTVALTPSPIGSELLLGLADPHLDLARAALGEVEAGEALGSEAPLLVRRSIWLELTGPEQHLLLRLERAMQWEFRWLQLEGIFGLPLAELFRDLGPTAAEIRQRQGPLPRWLRTLARLGKKLSAHGFLTTAVADQYLAMEDSDQGMTLVWQVTRERLSGDSDLAYRAAFATHLRAKRYPDVLPTLTSVILGGYSPAAQKMTEMAWGKIGGVTPTARLGGLETRPNQPILPQALFIEYLLRSLPEAKIPLPEALRSGPLGQLTLASDHGDLVERFGRFCGLVEGDPQFVRELRDVPLATLASPVSRRSSELTELLSVLRLSTPAAPLEVPKPPRLMGQKLAEPEAPKVMAEPKRSGAVSGALAARMLKVAAGELQRLLKDDPSRYQELKRLYLESLDETGRKLMLDVQRRIQPSMFEEQLRQRLVRFMVEHPGAWRSAEQRTVAPQTPRL